MRAPGPLAAVVTLLLASAVIRLAGGAPAALAAVQARADAPREEALIDDIIRRQADLDAREAALEERSAMRAAELEARAAAIDSAEAELRKSLEELGHAREALQAMLSEAEALGQGDLASLGKVYAAMRPAEAAALFAVMDPAFAAGFLARMPADAAAGIMAQLAPERAYAISAVIAGRAQRMELPQADAAGTGPEGAEP